MAQTKIFMIREAATSTTLKLLHVAFLEHDGILEHSKGLLRGMQRLLALIN